MIRLMIAIGIVVTIGIGMCAMISGCSEPKRDAQGRLVAEKLDGDRFMISCDVGGIEYTFCYVVVDGHEYLMMRGFGGITHSPKCQCIKNKEIREAIRRIDDAKVMNEMTGYVPL